jgi:hypothetical protein
MKGASRKAPRARARPPGGPKPKLPEGERLPEGGYERSHGYGPSHGGPSGPGDAPAEPAADGAKKHGTGLVGAKLHSVLRRAAPMRSLSDP